MGEKVLQTPKLYLNLGEKSVNSQIPYNGEKSSVNSHIPHNVVKNSINSYIPHNW